MLRLDSRNEAHASPKGRFGALSRWTLWLVVPLAVGCMGTTGTRRQLGLPHGVALKPVPEGVLATDGSAIWDRDGAFRLEPKRAFETPFFADRCVAPAADNFRAAREAGARPVAVQVPGAPQPLYGLLALCRVPVTASGPDARSYRIEVPTEYVAATREGRVSLVYAPTSVENYPAWQLWLSRSPRLWQ